MFMVPKVFELLKFYCVKKITKSYADMTGVFTEDPYRKPLKRNAVYIPITTLGQATSVTSNLIGRWCCSAVSRKTACKCFTASSFSVYIRLFVKVLIEKNVNISNELNLSGVYRRVNTLGR